MVLPSIATSKPGDVLLTFRSGERAVWLPPA